MPRLSDTCQAHYVTETFKVQIDNKEKMIFDSHLHTFPEHSYLCFSESWLRFFTVIMQLMSKGYPETLIELKLSVEEKVLLKTTLRQLKKEQNKPEGMVHLINLRLDLNTGLLFCPSFPEENSINFFPSLEDYCDLDRNLVPRHADFLFKVSLFPC